MLQNTGVAPHFFQLIKFTGVGQHYMHHNVYIIYQYPLLRRAAFLFVGELVTVFFYLVLYRICNGLKLRVGGSFADDKKICYCFRYFTQIETYNFLAFFFLDGIDDALKNFAAASKPGRAFFAALQYRKIIQFSLFSLTREASPK